MKNKIALIAISVVLALILGLAIWLLFFQGHSITPFSKLEVTNMKIDKSSDWSACYVSFTVYNRYNSPIIAIGQIVNGVNYGYTEITIPAGQTVDESLAIQNLKITNSSSYQIIVTFTFDDGNYEDYSQTVYPPQYVAAFSIFQQCFTYKEPNSTEYSLTIHDDGNIPIASANFTISNEDHMVIYQSDSISLGHLMPTAILTSQPIPYSSFQSSYIIYITVQVKFADGSTQSTQSSTLPVPTPPPTPTPTVSPTPTATPTPTPSPTPTST